LEKEIKILKQRCLRNGQACWEASDVEVALNTEKAALERRSRKGGVETVSSILS
jgi:hypothetical protein